MAGTPQQEYMQNSCREQRPTVTDAVLCVGPSLNMRGNKRVALLKINLATVLMIPHIILCFIIPCSSK